MAARRCLDCRVITVSGSRCKRCSAVRQATRNRGRAEQQKATYGGSWRRQSERTRKEWVAVNGWVCPGWDSPPHASTDLVVDHDVGVLCRKCNSSKAATFDRRRRRGWGGTETT